MLCYAGIYYNACVSGVKKMETNAVSHTLIMFP